MEVDHCLYKDVSRNKTVKDTELYTEKIRLSDSDNFQFF